MYQLFIALNKKQKAGLTGTAMETMRPAAPAKLDYMKSLIYKEVRPWLYFQMESLILNLHKLLLNKRVGIPLKMHCVQLCTRISQSCATTCTRSSAIIVEGGAG